MMKYDCLVVGAGPAGLAYASTLKDQTGVLIIDAGKAVKVRSRTDEEECLLGTGGAGLFSDGKFSFYPSGTKIWEQPKEELKKAYTLLENDLNPFEKIPSFPEIEDSNKNLPDRDGWKLKPYKSIYLSLEDRIKLIQNLARRCLNIRQSCEFVGYTKVRDLYKVQLKSRESGQEETILAKKIVFAGGRFMPHYLQCTKQFLRYEFGMRIEFPSSILKKPANLVDPKYTLEMGAAECRTFCWCNNGEVVPTRFKEFETYSGRADGPHTERSNFGFNFRIKDPSLLDQKTFQELVGTKKYTVRWSDNSALLAHIPPSLHKIVERGLTSLKERFPELEKDDVYVSGPTIEGVGEYPLTNKSFCMIDDPNLFVIGDCSGLYRGIVASMLSGYILANRHN